MKRLLLFTILVSIIGIAKAQWHFSITSMNYNANCSGNMPIVQAEVEVLVRIDLAKDWASETYSTKEECERMRSMATMNWSSGGCYIRTTTSPCTGGNIGGGGIGGNSQGAASQYSSTAIGEPYFAPNEAQVVSSMGNDLEIKLEAMNKSFNDAVGIRTGDLAFDINYRRQANELPNNIERTNEELYVFSPRTSRVYLEKENDFSDGTSDIIVPIDSERIKNQERDESWEKNQKEIQHRIDSIAEKNQRKIDSINKRQNNTNYSTASNNQYSSTGSLISETYKIGTGFIRKTDEWVKNFNETYGVTIPGSEIINNLNTELNNIEDGFKDLGEIVSNAFIGNAPGLASNFGKIINAEVIDPLKDMAFNTVNTLTNKYTHTKDMLKDVGNPLKKGTTGFADTILKGIKYTEKTGDPSYLDKTMYKGASRFSRTVAKSTQDYYNK